MKTLTYWLILLTGFGYLALGIIGAHTVWKRPHDFWKLESRHTITLPSDNGTVQFTVEVPSATIQP